MTFSPMQTRVLHFLDGATSDIAFAGMYAPALRALAGRGMVSYARSVRMGEVVYDVRLTNDGWEFIYNGGLDH